MSEFYIFFSLLFFLNILIIFNIDKINKFVNIYDVPDSKIKLHKRKTAITGGLIILVNLLLCAILSYSLHINLFPSKIQNIENCHESVSMSVHTVVTTVSWEKNLFYFEFML